MEGGINKSRRNFLKQAAAAASSFIVGGEALAQQRKDLPPGHNKMVDAVRELQELAVKEKERRDAKPYREALDAQKKLFLQKGNKNPLYHDYQDELAKRFKITDWQSDEGKKILRFMNDWYNEN